MCDETVMNDFTPWSALIGGILIGVSASALLVLDGRIAGISGIVGGLVGPRPKEISWRAMFVLGLLVGGAVLLWLMPSSFGTSTLPLPTVVLAGLFVGFGTRLGNGCTSGHGVCGLGRLSPRSLAATLTFMATGALTAFVVHHLLSKVGS